MYKLKVYKVCLDPGFTLMSLNIFSPFLAYFSGLGKNAESGFGFSVPDYL